MTGLLSLLGRAQGALPSRSFIPQPAPTQGGGVGYPAPPAGGANFPIPAQGNDGRPSPQSYYPGGLQNFWTGNTLNIPAMGYLAQQRAAQAQPPTVPQMPVGGAGSGAGPGQIGPGGLDMSMFSRFTGSIPGLPNPSYTPPMRGAPPVQTVDAIGAGGGGRFGFGGTGGGGFF